MRELTGSAGGGGPPAEEGHRVGVCVCVLAANTHMDADTHSLIYTQLTTHAHRDTHTHTTHDT